MAVFFNSRTTFLCSLPFIFLLEAICAPKLLCQENPPPSPETAPAYNGADTNSQISTFNFQLDSLPVINSIETRKKDIIFAQYSAELEENYKAVRSGKTPKVSFYAYTAKEGDTVFGLAARFNIKEDSFSIINGISSADEKLTGRTLIIPTAKGLFVPDPDDIANASQIEILLQKNRFPLEKLETLWYTIEGRRYAFFPDEIFTPTERAYFYDSSMVLPVKDYRISSRFGQREDPFGSGNSQFHKGVDMAVPEGSDVFACKSGIIAGTGSNRVYGNWILLDHSGGMSSFYAHLSYIGRGVIKGKTVRTGELIAKSGSTGQVTGPHLHFEIRKNGNAVDPNISERG